MIINTLTDMVRKNKERMMNMKKLIFNDGRSVEVQQVIIGEGVMHIRMILQTSDQLKAFFKDSFATARMTEQENGKESVYENYTKLSYIKEEAGGIWEVEMLQPEADVNTRLAEVEQQTQSNADALQEAIVELTTMMAAMIPQGAEESAEEVSENV